MGWRAGLPWAVAGASVGALITLLVVRATASGGPRPQAPAVSPSLGRASDISQMSPEERANRLFDRVMRYASAGQRDSTLLFLPMALQAHQMLPAMTPDSRFHIGLLSLEGGDVDAALAQADTIFGAAPAHLFGFILRARAYGQRADTARVRRAYADFLRNETAERERSRPEYTEHATTLDQFREEARLHAGR